MEPFLQQCLSMRLSSVDKIQAKLPPCLSEQTGKGIQEDSPNAWAFSFSNFMAKPPMERQQKKKGYQE